jgi:LmbE family N-acetylglucosaminyl deacetylase
MNDNLRLMCVLAHPDDESLGMGGTLAKYAREGIHTHLITATRGERGRFGDAAVRPELHVVGATREAELRAAAKELGIRSVDFLDYIDGDLDRADPIEVQGKIAAHIRRIRPQVVATFGPDGAYGHPDHIAILSTRAQRSFSPPIPAGMRRTSRRIAFPSSTTSRGRSRSGMGIRPR